MVGLPNLVLWTALLLPLLLLSGVAEGQTVEVRPREIADLLANPCMGWETFHRLADEDQNLAGLPSSTAYFRYYWKDVETEKDVISVLVSDAQKDSVFEAMFRAGELDRPNAGFMYATKIEKMAAYVPESIMTELREAGKVRSAL